MQVFYRNQVDMEIIRRDYRLLDGQKGIPHRVELGEHEDIGPNDSDASKMYNRDHGTVIGFMDKYYKDSGADIILIDGGVDQKHALSKRVFVCKTNAFRAKRKKTP